MKKERKFWVISNAEEIAGYDSSDIMVHSIYWGTWYEAARECVKRTKYPFLKPDRKVKEFNLPDVKNKRKPFYVFNEGVEYA